MIEQNVMAAIGSNIGDTIGREVSKLTLCERMVEAARSYIGVPFFHAGRNRNGLDCVGLLVLATHDVGIDVFDEISYSPIINANYLKSRIDKCCHKIDEADASPGDMVLFRVGRSEQHMALVTEVNGHDTRIIHSFQTIGRVIEHELDAHWQNRIAGFYRLNDEVLM
jgi:hypothetical protein